MVLCKYFQQGNCRYGSRCTNEHFDVKQIIKTDVDAAINGKQWPLSCYGPFKDKPSIPNFIEDQSFEEIRYLCYESKQRNFFQQFHQQFTKEVLEAKNKLKSLQQLTPDVVNVVTALYDKPLNCSNNNSVNSNNPFSFNSGQTDSGLFAKAATQPTTGFAGVGSFGSGGTTVNAGSIFANNNNNSNNPASSGGPFGGTATTSPFAKLPTNQQGSIFGQQPTASSATMFGAAPNQQPAGFNQSIQAQNPSVGGIFGQAAKPQAPCTTGLFAQAVQQAPSTGLFAQAAQQTASAFTQQQTQPNAFGRTLQTQPTNTNVFTQQQQQQNQFQQLNAVTGAGLFATAAAQTQNIFQQQQQQQTSNIFAQAQTQNAITGFAQQSNCGSFMQPTQAMNASENASATGIRYGSVYSRLEDLTPEEIEAFKADHFSEGKIPFSPPPREHIN